MTEPVPAPIHISVVLDRSGSMQPIADDVVGGCNAFLAEQRAKPGAARLTLAQFDSQEPFEVLIAGADLQQVPDLPRAAYAPRGMTPLYDAVGSMIARIDDEVAARAHEGLAEEDQEVVIITDGHENHSVRFGRAAIFGLIEERRQAGWVFVFLGADQDHYAEGGHMGVAPAARVGWDKTAAGTRKMWSDLSYSTSQHRQKPREQRRAEADEFHSERPPEQ